MAYKTGTAATKAAFHAAIVDFLVNEAGWDLHDTVGTSDVVVRSTGEAGKHNLTIRLDLGAGTRDPRAAMNYTDYIGVRGYHVWTPSQGGQKEWGRWGPWVFLHHKDTPAFWRPKGGFESPQIFTAEGGGGIAGACPFDGRRRFFVSEASALRAYDFTTGKNYLVTAGLPRSPQIEVFAYDRATGRDYVWLRFESTSSNWYRVDVVSGELTRRADIPISASTAITGAAWDGGDCIYVLAASSSPAPIRRYRISTDTWETVASIPLVVGSGAPPYARASAVYVKAGPSSSEDTVWFAFGSSSSAATARLARYGVTTGTVTLFDTLGNGWGSSGASIAYDGDDSLYTFAAFSSTYLRVPLADPTAWETTPLQSPWGSSVAQVPTIHWMNQQTGKIRCPDADGRFWLVGDMDGLAVVTRCFGRFYWSYFGRANPLSKELATRVHSACEPGRNVVSVDSSEGFTVGERVILYHPGTGAAMACVVGSLPSPTTLEIITPDAMPAGAVVGMDPNCAVITGDSWLASCPLDGRGFESDETAANYRLRPAQPSSYLNNSSPTPRGQIAAVPFQLYSNQATLPATAEVRGSLPTVWALFKLPTRVPGEQLRIAGKTYLCFPQAEAHKTEDDCDILVGPID